MIALKALQLALPMMCALTAAQCDVPECLVLLQPSVAVPLRSVVLHMQPAAQEPAVDLLSLPADKFEEAARETLSALAGYVSSLTPIWMRQTCAHVITGLWS